MPTNPVVTPPHSPIYTHVITHDSPILPPPTSPLAWEPMGISLAAYALLLCRAEGREGEEGRMRRREGLLLPLWLRELLRCVLW